MGGFSVTLKAVLAERSSDAVMMAKARRILDAVARNMKRLELDDTNRRAYAMVRTHDLKIWIVIQDFFEKDEMAIAERSEVGVYTIRLHFSHLMRLAGSRRRFKDYYDQGKLTELSNLTQKMLQTNTVLRKFVLHEIVHVLDFERGADYIDAPYGKQHMELSAYLHQEMLDLIDRAKASYNPTRVIGRNAAEFTHIIWGRVYQSGLTRPEDGFDMEDWKKLMKRAYTNYDHVFKAVMADRRKIAAARRA